MIPHIRETFVEHGIEAFRKVPNGRAYAVDLDAAAALGSLAAAWRDQLAPGETFTREQFAKEVLTPLSKYEKSLVQDRGDDEAELPVWPVDSWSGQKVSNPWAPESENLTEQGLIEKFDPKLAEMMRERAKGVSFSLVEKLEREKAKREKLRQLKYDSKANPFFLSGKEGLAAQSKFAKEHEHYEVKFFQREANEPVKLESFAGNLTVRMQIAKHAPELAGIIEAARAIHTQWQKDDARRLEQEVAQRQAELQRTQAQLAAK